MCTRLVQLLGLAFFIRPQIPETVASLLAHFAKHWYTPTTQLCIAQLISSLCTCMCVCLYVPQYLQNLRGGWWWVRQYSQYLSVGSEVGHSPRRRKLVWFTAPFVREQLIIVPHTQPSFSHPEQRTMCHFDQKKLESLYSVQLPLSSSMWWKKPCWISFEIPNCVCIPLRLNSMNVCVCVCISVQYMTLLMWCLFKFVLFSLCAS